MLQGDDQPRFAGRHQLSGPGATKQSGAQPTMMRHDNWHGPLMGSGGRVRTAPDSQKGGHPHPYPVPSVPDRVPYWR